jgi:serine/threonine protein kinase
MGAAATTGNKGMPVGNRKFNQCYMLAKELGSGAFSIVKLGIHLETGKKTAVKIVSKKKLSEEDFASLMTEIEILAELDHPHIIKLFETFDEGTDFYIVTELVEGGELFDRIVSKAHYTEKEARDLIKLMLETMAYMHGQGVVHRDLKPENLLLCSETDDSDIKIADFGFAKRIKDLSPKETACGTPGYVAPEILRGDRYGAEVDVWSMGVICYVLLAGYPPFYDEDQKRLFKKIKEGRYHFHEDYWGNTSPEAINMIQMMLCVDQTKRWTAEQLLKHPWITMGDETLEAKDLTNSIVVMKKFNARRRLRAAADAVIMANRMNRMLGRFRGNGEDNSTASVQKKVSLLDPDALQAVQEGTVVVSAAENADAEDFNRLRTRLSFDTSDQTSEEPSLHPALDLLYDKDLEGA